jgi:putative addiction module component (TIGR02574 family)
MSSSLPLDKMTVSDKIALMEQIWDDLCKEPESVPSPIWHKEVLAAREEQIKEGKAKFISLDSAKERIRNKTK